MNGVAFTKFELLTSPSFEKIRILSILFLTTQRDPRTFHASTAVPVLAFPSSYLKVPIGDKSQQIPRYSPVCPRGHTPGMAADKCIMQSLSRIVTKRTKVPNFVYSFLGIWVSYLRWVPKKETSCYRIKREILFIIALLCLVTRLFLKIVFATVLSGKMAQNQCKDFPE